MLVVGYGASLLLRGLLELPALLSYLLFTVTVAHALGAFSHQVRSRVGWLPSLAVSHPWSPVFSSPLPHTFQGGDFVKALGATGAFPIKSIVSLSSDCEPLRSLNDFMQHFSPASTTRAGI